MYTDTCWPFKLMLFIFFCFECYFMILKSQQYKNNKKGTLFYLQNSLTYTTIINLLIVAIIIVTNALKFKHIFHFIIGVIGMLCGLCSILICMYYLYVLFRGIRYISLSIFWDNIMMIMKCFVLAYVTFFIFLYIIHSRYQCLRKLNVVSKIFVPCARDVNCCPTIRTFP